MEYSNIGILEYWNDGMMSPLRKVVKMKLATDSQIYIKIKSVIISAICGRFFSTISNKYIFGADSMMEWWNNEKVKSFILS